MRIWQSSQLCEHFVFFWNCMCPTRFPCVRAAPPHEGGCCPPRSRRSADGSGAPVPPPLMAFSFDLNIHIHKFLWMTYEMFCALPKTTQGPKIPHQFTWKENEACTALVCPCVYHAHAHIFIFQIQRWSHAKLNTNSFHSFHWSNGRWSKSPSSLFLANHFSWCLKESLLRNSCWRKFISSLFLRNFCK